VYGSGESASTESGESRVEGSVLGTVGNAGKFSGYAIPGVNASALVGGAAVRGCVLVLWGHQISFS